MPENYDNAPVLDSVDPPTEDRSQKSDDEDLERGSYKVSEPRRIGQLDIDSLAENNNAPASFKNQVKPDTTTPDMAYIHHRIPENPLESLPTLFSLPPEFLPGIHLSQERKDMLGVLMNGVVWPENRKLVVQVHRSNEMDVAWDETEKGPPVVIPTKEHVPRVHRRPPIPPGTHNKVLKCIPSEIRSVFKPSHGFQPEQSNLSYSAKDRSVQIKSDLQPLTTVHS